MTPDPEPILANVVQGLVTGSVAAMDAIFRELEKSGRVFSDSADEEAMIICSKCGKPECYLPALESRCCNAPLLLGHCWHNDRPIQYRTKLEGEPTEFHTGVVEKCCFCGVERNLYDRLEKDPEHGPHQNHDFVTHRTILPKESFEPCPQRNKT